MVVMLIPSNIINAQGTEFNWDTVDFENGMDYLFIDTSETNTWHVCKPEKSFFDSAYSPTRAVLTDSAGYYPVSNHSFFDLYIGTFNIPWYPHDIYIEITHKYDTDTLRDGGFITVSCDGGKTWMNIINDEMCIGIGPMHTGKNLYSQYDTLFTGEPGFSGRSDGWIKTEFAWYVAITKRTMNEPVDTMIVRFNFISDSIPSDKEGWMIDDIRLFSVDIGGEINNSYPSGHFRVFPNPAVSEVNLEFDKIYHSIDIEIFDLSSKIIGKSFFRGPDNCKLDCTGLNSGIYVLRIILDSEEICYHKLLIRK